MGEGDTGPNTGGMGSYSPAPVLTPEIERQAMEQLIYPTARGMCAEGTPFRGVLFAGLMIKNGQARLRAWSWAVCGDTVCAGLAGAGRAAESRAQCSEFPTPCTARSPPAQAKLLEHNVRFGDPECQSLMVRLQSDLLESLLAQCRGEDVKLQW